MKTAPAHRTVRRVAVQRPKRFNCLGQIQGAQNNIPSPALPEYPRTPRSGPPSRGGPRPFVSRFSLLEFLPQRNKSSASSEIGSSFTTTLSIDFIRGLASRRGQKLRLYRSWFRWQGGTHFVARLVGRLATHRNHIVEPLALVSVPLHVGGP